MSDQDVCRARRAFGRSGAGAAVSPRILITGASHAGVQLAAALRAGGHYGSIHVVAAEPHLPYHRTPLSNAVLDGAATVTSRDLRPATFSEAKRAQLPPGTSHQK